MTLNFGELHNDYKVEIVKWKNGYGSGEKIYIKDKEGNIAGCSCAKCKQIKPATEFKKQKSNSLNSYCRECRQEDLKERITLGQRVDILEEAVICINGVVQEHEEKIGLLNKFMLNFKKIFKI